jgi:hypothetical protein
MFAPVPLIRWRDESATDSQETKVNEIAAFQSVPPTFWFFAEVSR